MSDKPSRATALLNASALYAVLNGSGDPEHAERALKALPDEQFRMAVEVAATLLSTLKREAIRRGVWDDFKGVKVK